jgi:hypothetical protein
MIKTALASILLLLASAGAQAQTAANCGTGAVVTGSDTAGTVKLGADFVSNPSNYCFVLFAKVWQTRPICLVVAVGNPDVPLTPPVQYTVAANSMAITGAAPLAFLEWHCAGSAPHQ